MVTARKVYTLNNQTIKAAARKLCWTRKLDPDKTTRMYEGCVHSPPILYSALAEAEIQKVVDILDVLEFVCKQQELNL